MRSQPASRLLANLLRALFWKGKLYRLRKKSLTWAQDAMAREARFHLLSSFLGSRSRQKLRAFAAKLGERRQPLGQAKLEKDERNPRELPKEAFLPTS